MFKRREAYQDPTTQIRRSLYPQMVPELRPCQSLLGLGHLYAHVTELAPNVKIFKIS